jgi:translation initiation factor 2-alpha kinase 4
MLLSRLNHPCVVRYYTAWPEEEYSGTSETDEDASTTMTGNYSDSESDISPGNSGSHADFTRSTGGLDFVSNSHRITFGSDDEMEEDEDDGAVVFGSDTGKSPRSTAITSHVNV